MGNSTKPRFGAIGAGALCALGAAAVLVEDVRHTHTVTLDHLLAVIVLVGTIAAGVMAVGMLKTWRTWHYAAALIVLAGIGSIYCMMGTAGRTAEDRAAAKLEADAANEKREAIRKKIAEAEFILASCPDGSPKKWFGERCGLRDAQNRECASGNGTACTGKSYSVGTYEAAIKGHSADLDALGPEKPVNTRVKNAAAIIGAFQNADEAQQARIEATITLIEPNIPALFLEAGSIVFLHIGLPTLTWSAFVFWRLAPANDQAPARPTVTTRKRARRGTPEQRRQELADFRKAFLKKHGQEPQPADVRAALGFPRRASHDYLREQVPAAG
jgi:hypothetical protein